jgi:hypothetical protein
MTLELHSLEAAGVPHEERVIFWAREAVDLKLYGVLVGVDIGNGSAIPMPDNYYWFGHITLEAGDWVFLYSGPGTTRTVELNDGKKLHNLYWGRKKTMFYDRKIVPILISMDLVSIYRPEPLKPRSQELAATPVTLGAFRSKS